MKYGFDHQVNQGWVQPKEREDLGRKWNGTVKEARKVYVRKSGNEIGGNREM